MSHARCRTGRNWRGRPGGGGRIAGAAAYAAEMLESRMLLSGTWTPLTNAAPDRVGTMLLLPNGSVMTSSSPYGSGWALLTPDSSGSYVNGTWTSLANSNYARGDFASQVLPDGRVLFIGGEYGDGKKTAEVYDPLTNAWQTVDPNSDPTLDPGFLDCESTLLPNGDVLVAPVIGAPGSSTAIFDPHTNTWLAQSQWPQLAVPGWWVGNTDTTTYVYDNTTNSGGGQGIATGHIEGSNGTFTSSTTVCFSPTDSNNDSNSLPFSTTPVPAYNVIPSDNLYLRDTATGASCLFEVTSTPVLNNSNWTAGVTSIQSTGTFNSGDPVMVTWRPWPYYGGYNADEASWVRLRDDSILLTPGNGASERYIPSSNEWVADQSVPVQLYDNVGEQGPGILLSNGQAFFAGSTGQTAIFDPSGDTWTAGPTFPFGPNSTDTQVQLGADDAPMAMLPDGTVLIAAGPAANRDNSATDFVLYTPGNTTNPITNIAGPPINADLNGPPVPVATENDRMLDLPNGQVLFSYGAGQLYTYAPGTSPLTAAKPTITSIVNNSDGSLTLSGTGLNGLDAGAAFGDDAQMNTNYPIISLTAGTNVYYATSYNWSNTGTGPSGETVNFRLPLGVPPGTYSVTTSANGVASTSVPLTISTTANNAAPTIASPAAASPSEVTGTTTNLSVLGADDGGEANLVYTWTATSVPTGARLPSFSVNGNSAETTSGTNLDAARNTTVTFYNAGTYTFNVVVTDAGGLSTSTQVSVTVDAEAPSISISPARVEINQMNPGATQQMSASVVDQFGLDPAVQPIWSISASGTDTEGAVSSTGLYTAPAVGALDTIQAAVGTVTATAKIGVAASPWASKDLGQPGLTGLAGENSDGHGFTVEGSGNGIQSTTPSFQLVYRSVSAANETVTARVLPQAASGEAGVIFAGSSLANYVSLTVSPAGGNLQLNLASWQSTSGNQGTLQDINAGTIPAPQNGEWLRVAQVGSNGQYTYYGYRSDDGINWAPVGSITVTLSVPLVVGVAVSSDNNSALDTSKFDSVSFGTRTSTTTLAPGSGPNPSNTSQALSFVAGVTLFGGSNVPPDGDGVALVDTSNNDAVVATGTLSGGSATLTVPAGTLAAGTHNLVAVYEGDGTNGPSEWGPYAQTVLPPYIAASAGTACSYNSTTGALSLTSGTLTFTADSAADTTDLPVNLTASGSSSSVVFNTSQHLAGLTLSGGAQATVLSLGSARTHSNHNVLVIGSVGATSDPAFSIDSSSRLDLQDNDLIVHTGSSDAGGSTAFGQVVTMANVGRNVPVGSVLDGKWNGNGLTSSVAASVDASLGFERNVLAVVRNVDMVLGQLSRWTVGSFSEPLRSNDIIVKYTYNGDAALEGYVGDNSVTIVNGYYGMSENDWAFGDFTGSGTVDDSDITILNGLYGDGTAGSGLPQL